jgi:maltose 6'-phosphate phosphatase
MRTRAPLVALACLALAVCGCEENDPIASADSSLVDARSGDAGPSSDVRAEAGAPDKGPDTSPDLGADTTPAKPTLSLVTYNVHCLLDQPALRAEGIAKELASRGAQVIGLQEVCQTQGQNDNFAQTLIDALKKETKRDWEYRFTSTHVAWSKYDEGLAIVAPKGAIKDHGEQLLPQGSGAFPRKVLWARVDSGDREVLVYNTHLTISKTWQDRVAQVQSLLTLARSHDALKLPRFVVGDFNDVSWYTAVKTMVAGPPAFVDSWASLHSGQDGFTIGSASPDRRIDYIFVEHGAVSSIKRVELAFTQQYKGVWMSDHRGLLVEVELH